MEHFHEHNRENTEGFDNETKQNSWNEENVNFENDATEPEDKQKHQWHNDDYEPAISGTVSDRHALCVYKPKAKKRIFRHPIVAAVVSAAVTSALCFGIFAASYSAIRNQLTAVEKPTGSALSVQNSSPENSVNSTVNVANNGQMSIPDIYDKVSPAVVSIVISTTNGNSAYLQNSVVSSSGSGVILTSDGYIVTNNHVVDGASIITVKTTANQTMTAQVVGKDERTDLAVLKVECDRALPYAELGDSSALRVGDVALAIGNPLKEALASTLTVGYISAINRTMILNGQQMTMLQTDAAINPGNSGGALINIYGQVIGINTAKSTGYDVEGLGFAIPINEAIPVIESIIEHGYVKGRPIVGITGIDVTEQIARANNLPIGVYVNEVTAGGAAELGGVKVGDVILKFDGKEVKSIDDVNEIKDKHSVGDKIDIVVSRNGAKVNLTITLQEEKPMENTETTKPQQNKVQGEQYQFPSDFFSWFGW